MSSGTLRKLAPEVNRILYVRNLPYKMTSDEMYKIFGKYGALRQIRAGNAQATRGTAFVVYHDIHDAKAALESLSGFNVGGRYIIVLYYQAGKGKGGKESEESKKRKLEESRKKLEEAKEA
ncbi:hypothetical protein TeGR_g563 [Tetraparma gracilis]|uniref:RRM domain-containing protein n=1 Tax=Tetraparma gracilis TaxID=2962635 RepID=A0ABQ6N4U5_9STRA|nr:hypothetical protein TeGR_g563 [Tetraparma gracilis]